MIEKKTGDTAKIGKMRESIEILVAN